MFFAYYDVAFDWPLQQTIRISVIIIHQYLTFQIWTKSKSMRYMFCLHLMYYCLFLWFIFLQIFYHKETFRQFFQHTVWWLIRNMISSWVSHVWNKSWTLDDVIYHTSRITPLEDTWLEHASGLHNFLFIGWYIIIVNSVTK